jgi:hypothetical protein
MSTETKETKAESKKRKLLSLDGWLERPDKKARPEVSFVECKSAGYPARTAINVEETDGTLILAVDSSTPGEKLTTKLCVENQKPFLVVDIEVTPDLEFKLTRGKMVRAWASRLLSLNIAGNCITRFPPGVTQAHLNKLVYDLVADLSLVRIQTGGQTGIDEAGAMAGLKLGISTKVVAPKGWMFRGRDGKDVSSEKLFKSRFQ